MISAKLAPFLKILSPYQRWDTKLRLHYGLSSTDTSAYSCSTQIEWDFKCVLDSIVFTDRVQNDNTLTLRSSDPPPPVFSVSFVNLHTGALDGVLSMQWVNGVRDLWDSHPNLVQQSRMVKIQLPQPLGYSWHYSALHGNTVSCDR